MRIWVRRGCKICDRKSGAEYCGDVDPLSGIELSDRCVVLDEVEESDSSDGDIHLRAGFASFSSSAFSRFLLTRCHSSVIMSGSVSGMSMLGWSII